MLEKIKRYLSLDGTTIHDQLITDMIESATTQLRLLVNEPTISEELQFIIVEVVVSRFNRLSSEGMTSQSIEGLSMSFESDYFAPHMRYIEVYLSRRDNATTGVLRFL